MLWLAAIGFFMGAAGLAGVLYCMCSAWIARKSAPDEKALRDRIGKLVPLNLVSLIIAAAGLVVATVAFIL